MWFSRCPLCIILDSKHTQYFTFFVKCEYYKPVVQVLFPLLEEVKCLSSTAPDESLERAESSTPILVHHTRNTACKQWAETQVGAISGVARVFQVCLEFEQGAAGILSNTII